jgi:hypothetical protein
MRTLRTSFCNRTIDTQATTTISTMRSPASAGPLQRSQSSDCTH